MIRANELPTPLVWIEHWPEESTGGDVRQRTAREQPSTTCLNL